MALSLVRVSNSGPLVDMGLQCGDVIVSINQVQVSDPNDAATRLKEAEAQPNKRLLLLLNRHGISEFVGSWSGPDEG